MYLLTKFVSFVRDLLKYFLSIELTMEQLNSQNWVDKIDSILKEIKKRKVIKPSMEPNGKNTNN